MTAPDVRLAATITDVRCRGTAQAACEGGALSDYSGELAAATTLRITDRHNAVVPGGTDDGATVTDTPLSFRFQCVPNPAGASATAIGATCSTVTRLNAVIPGALLSAKRGNWELGQVAVQDGGADGDVDTAGNGVFLRQGIFVP